MDEPEKIVFIVSLPLTQSAILFDGMGDSARTRIDVSRQYVNEIIKFQSLASKYFKVTIELGGKDETRK